ncbi:U4/U6 small nuclear ribonucleoprotein Prp4 [Ceratobasidium sp. AG-Ba]|nr:U4/U6 small nuclear ribonucleoprotein Prp4 [Ceratobasidium sp. AG-Ba]
MADGGLTLDTLVDDRNYALGGSDRARAENQALINELDRKKRARQMAVPTDDNRVKARLREIGEPITLFGERAADRRDRLIYVLSQIQVARGDDDIEMEDESSSSDEEKEEEFYTEGSLELLEARRRIAEYSLPRAQLRVAQQREESRLPLGRIIDARKRVFGEIKKFTTYGSQIGDERPISQVRFSPDGKLLATGSWSGNVKLWNVPACDLATSLRAHGDRIGGVAWHPQATLAQSADSVNLVTGGADCEVSLWSLNSDKAVHTFKGHSDRVCRVAFHPSGQYVASASYDGSWRLWDASTGQNSGKHVVEDQDRQLLFQEGHSKEVYAVQFQDDGALVASGGLDAIGRVWDLRTGRTAMVLDGHGQAIYGMDFSPNGYQIATGSGDNTVRIWDMRSLRALYTIGAHTSIVSDVSFYRPVSGDIFTAFAAGPSDVKMEDGLDSKAEVNGDVKQEMEDVKPTFEASKSGGTLPVSGLFLVSSGYDGMVKVWSADDWQLVKALSADAGKVMSASIAPHGELIASGSWNRSYQLFSMED